MEHVRKNWHIVCISFVPLQALKFLQVVTIPKSTTIFFLDKDLKVNNNITSERDKCSLAVKYGERFYYMKLRA